MADRALSEEAMIAGLRDIRLPSDAAGGLLAEMLAALALGLILAVGLGLVLRLVSQARPRGTPPQPVDTLAEDAQALALLRRLKEVAPERYRVLAAQIYQPGGMPDLEQLRREVREHV